MAEIRIISGIYKNRRIQVRDAVGLRPTPERVRETLFNWLQFEIVGARVLDAFAGSGALGLEALSRGAAHAIFLDNNINNIKKIKELTKKWNVQNFEAYAQDALKFNNAALFDVIFIDPPFAENITAVAIKKFLPLLKPTGYLYVESAQKMSDFPMLKILKSGRAGAVNFALAQAQDAE